MPVNTPNNPMKQKTGRDQKNDPQNPRGPQQDQDAQRRGRDLNNEDESRDY